MKRNQWVRKLVMTSVVLTMVFPMLAACSGGKDTKTGQERTLRIGVLYGGYDDTYFRQQFTDVYEYTHQNVKIEIVPAIDQSDQQYNQGEEKDRKEPNRLEAVKKIMDGSNPVDIIVTDPAQFRILARDGMLKQLDPLMQQDKFDTNDFVPAVLDGIKSMGDGNMLGLAPTFNSSVLLYNKKLFADAGVEPPTDGMTWDEVFNKARLVAKGEGADRKYGFSFDRYAGGDPFWSMTYSYITPLQLRMFDNKGEKMTVNTGPWEKVWNSITKLSTDKIMPTQNDGMMDNNTKPGPFDHDSFLSGKVAMVLSDFGYLNNDLANAMRNASKIKGFNKFDWDVVTAPSHPEAPGVSGSVNMNNIFAINNKAPNPDDAWDFVKFINSEDWAKIRSRSSYEMVSRKQFIKPKDGSSYNIDAFFNVKPVVPTNQDAEDLMSEKPALWQVNDIGRTLFQDVINGKKSTKQALAEWETKGNEMLQQIKNNPNGGGETVPGGIYGG
ncbi:extracellular solute-binding protein [Paenibacillus sp. UMB4589-SE434]|uniref:ABC transporter substrate-binding protein n=1 Tax=Paenibacillus sp. UMB4589-SE434 TaxID=3046314 RepID=UPI0025518E22|nr:extracellular solute-binding protein [Paenibacillus sp. UMB4589-SE434]MDK8180903.1 extracellular solute-binding protein [Paenibacillus sp. UMB4589-SE434]